jgi:hypothetical protein
MGHRDRRFLAKPDHWRRIMPGGGILRPSIVVDGAIVGTWSVRRQGAKLEIDLEQFTTLDADARSALEAEVDDVRRFESRPATRDSPAQPPRGRPSRARARPEG